MIDKAIAKITDEMMKSNNPAIRNIEEHLTKICTNEVVAEKILADGKTLKGAYNAMKEEARRMAGGTGEICISDEDGFRIVDEYFDIGGSASAAPAKIDIMDLL